MERNQHCVLLAVCGTSPAVISETVQAIYGKFDRYVIDEVIVLTTTIGKARLVSQLLDSGAWDQLKKELDAPHDTLRWGNCEDSIRLISSLDKSRNLSDICSPDDHLAMANQLCNLIRGYADNPNITILASLAGGRKTMSTMMGFCFSLYAREQDKLFHVLVNEPYDSQMTPPFLFKPKKPVNCKLAGGRVVSTADAVIELIDIPFVRLRKLFPKFLSVASGSYSELVAQANEAAEQKGNQLISFDLSEGECSIGSTCVINGRKAPLLFIVYFTVAWATVHGEMLKSPLALANCADEIHEHLMAEKNVCRKLREELNLTPLAISKALNTLKKKLAAKNVLYDVVKNASGAYLLEVDPKTIQLDTIHALTQWQP